MEIRFSNRKNKTIIFTLIFIFFINNVIAADTTLEGGILYLPNGIVSNGWINIDSEYGIKIDNNVFLQRKADGKTYYYDNGGGLFIKNNVGNDNIVILNNGNVGIGTMGANRKMEVSGSADTRIRISNSGATSFEGLEFVESGTTIKGVVGYENTASRDRMEFYTSGDLATPRMVIQGNGNVGIGTTTPASLLHVAGGDIRLNTGEDLILGSTNALIRGTDGNAILLRSSATDTMTLTGGNVGIGTTGPNALLHVKSSAAPSIARIIINGDNGAQVAGTESGGLEFRATNNQYIVGRIASLLNGDASGGDLAFYTTPAGGGISEKVRILANGNVGIGTANPTAKLDVEGHAKAWVMDLSGAWARRNIISTAAAAFCATLAPTGNWLTAIPQTKPDEPCSTTCNGGTVHGCIYFDGGAGENMRAVKGECDSTRRNYCCCAGQK